MRGSKVKDLGRILLSAALFSAAASQAAEDHSETRSKSSAKVFKVGVLLSLTGDFKATGVEIRQGAQIAAHEFADHSGGKARIELVFVDDESSVEVASRRAEALVREHKVHAVVGPSFLAGASVAAPLFETAKIPFVVPLSKTATWSASKNARFMRLEEAKLGDALARFALKNLRVKTFALIDEATSDASKSFNDGFSRALAAQKKIRNVGRFSFIGANEEAPKLLGELAKLKADAVSLPTTSWEAARAFLDLAPASGVPALFLGSSSWAIPAEAKKVPGPIGHFFADVFSVSQPGARGFIESFRKEYSEDPSGLAAMSFEAVSVLGQAYRKAGYQDEGKLQVALQASTGFDGIAGKLRFDRDSSPVRDVVIMETTQSGIPRFRGIIR